MKRRIRAVLSILLSFCVLLSAVPVLARSPQKDAEQPYSGDVVMAVNENWDIDSDGALEDSFQRTGLSDAAAENGPAGEREDLCGGGMLRADGRQIIHELPELPVTRDNAQYREGDEKKFYSDYYKGENKTFTARVVSAGDNSVLWVDKSIPEPDMEAMEACKERLETVTVPNMKEYFGNWDSVDVDGDGKVSYVFYPMIDPAIQGFFYGADLFTKEEIEDATGNHMDMLNLNWDCFDGENTPITIAHELQHLVNFGRTGGQSDAWLNETFSECAQMICACAKEENMPEAARVFDYIGENGYAYPFVYSGTYVPFSGEPYGNWLLFGMYLRNQTMGYTGGGDALFKSLLDREVSSGEGESSYGACTREALIQTLTDIGYLDSERGPADFEELVLNYQASLFLRDGDGLYSLTGDADNPSTLLAGKSSISVPDLIPSGTAPGTIPGGGAACWVLNQGETTPENPGTSLRFSGLVKEEVTDPEEVTASLSEGPVAAGSLLELSCPTAGASVYYTKNADDLWQEEGTLYTEPILIEEDVTVRAWAVLDYGTEQVTGPGKSFRYQVSAPAGDQYESNENFGEAKSVSFPATLNGTLHTGQDCDYFSFLLESQKQLSLTLTPPAGGSCSLSLYGEDYALLAESGIEDAGQNIRYTASPGRYYVAVKNLGEDVPALSETYQLSLRAEYGEGETSQLDFSEMNMVTALGDQNKSDMAYEDILNNGGHAMMAEAYLTAWKGPVEESLDPYPNEEEQKAMDSSSLHYQDLSADARYHVQNTLILPNDTRESFDANMKNGIYNYGAVNIYMLSAACYWTSDLVNFYVDRRDYAYKTQYDGGHLIAVVGWDDNYSRENFTGYPEYAESFGYDNVQMPRPEKDGAWICKNSWGDAMGENGYFYLSYEDAFLMTNSPAIFLADELTDNYNHQYYNDKKGAVAYWVENQLCASSVFVCDAEGPELLRAVSMGIGSSNTKYEIAVKTGDHPAKKVAEGVRKYAGYHTVRFDRPLLLQKGETFEVIVRLEGTDESPASLGCTMNQSGLVSGVSPTTGRAYFYTNGVKSDVGEEGYYPCIRAYTYDAEDTAYRATVLSKEQEVEIGSETIAPPDGQEKTVQFLRGENSGSQAASNGGSVPVSLPYTSARAAQDAGELPARFDLRETDTMTPVRNQENLGTCWAFASVASLESSIARNGGTAIDYPRSISLDHSEMSVVLDREQTEKAVSLTAMLEGAVNPSSQKIFWSLSGDMDSVRLGQTESFSGENTAVFTALKPGVVTITAQSDADMYVKASCVVTIAEQGVDSLSVTPAELSMQTGETRQLQVSVTPENAVDAVVLYTSSNPGIAYVDDGGFVTAVSAGSARITVQAGQEKAEVPVTVTEQEATPTATPTDTPTATPTATPGTTPPGAGGGQTGTKTETVKNAKTGDTSPLWPLLFAGLISAVGIAVVLRRKRRV